jgi:hypothetical protein
MKVHQRLCLCTITNKPSMIRSKQLCQNIHAEHLAASLCHSTTACWPVHYILIRVHHIIISFQKSNPINACKQENLPAPRVLLHFLCLGMHTLHGSNQPSMPRQGQLIVLHCRHETCLSQQWIVKTQIWEPGNHPTWHFLDECSISHKQPAYYATGAVESIINQAGGLTSHHMLDQCLAKNVWTNFLMDF